MICEESVEWLECLRTVIGQSQDQDQDLWHYEQALAEAIELLRSDRVVVLPCKVGETLYCVRYNDHFVKEYKNISLVNLLTLMAELENPASRIVLLTGNKEEAEAKQKELNNGTT